MDTVALKPLNTTYGAVTLSSFLSAALFGFTFLQTYTYFVHRSANDTPLMKLGVGLLWIVDCLQAFFIVWAVYWYLVQHFFQSSALSILHWPIPLTWVMAATGSFLAEGYFVPQVWILSRKNKVLTGLLVFASLAQYAFALVFFVHMIRHINTNVIVATDGHRIPVILQQVFAIFSNNVIVGALCVYNHTPNEGIFIGASALDGLLTILFERGLLSGLFQVAYLLVYVLCNNTFLWFPFQVATSKLLVNAILAKLNSRERKIDKESVGFDLGNISTRLVVPVAEHATVVTAKAVDSPAPSMTSKITRASE